MITSLQKLQRIHQSLLSHKVTAVYTGVLMVGTYEVRDDVPTARTNGVDVQYGDAFIGKLTEPDLRGIVLHEALHKVLQHTFMAKHLFERDAMIANMAVDYVVNLIVKDIEIETGGFVTLPADGLYSEQYRGWSSSQIFHHLMQNRAPEPEKRHPKRGKDKSEDTPKKGKGKGDGGIPSDGRGQHADEHDWENAATKSPEEIQKIKKMIDSAMRQGQILAGRMGGKQSRLFGELTQVKERYEDLLRDYLTSVTAKGDHSTWAKPNRRWLSQGILMPSTYSENMKSMAIAVDLSGSIDMEMYTQFMSHVVAICQSIQPESLHLLFWDTKINRHEVYGRGDFNRITEMKPVAGGGGTDVSCVFEHIEKNQLDLECVVVLTDAYTPFPPQPKVPVLWAITSNETAPWGQQIKIEN